MSAMPLVLYPTELLWVDDDELFLQAAIEGFKRTHKIKAFFSAEECFGDLNKNQLTSASFPFFRGCREYEEYDLSDRFPVDVNLNAILTLRDNPQRSQDITVIIVDYNMPGETGIELCRKLQGLPIKKILLTGEASHEQAINAFNDGIIDCFIRKDEMALASDLLIHIEKLHAQYFADMTKPLLMHLEADSQLPQSDPIFIYFFNQWCRDNKINEYYLADKNGTFLTINKNGLVQYFVTHTDRSIDAFTTLYNEEKEINPLIVSAKKREKIPFFGIKNEPWNFELSEWENCFYPLNILEGREKYYWTVIKN